MILFAVNDAGPAKYLGFLAQSLDQKNYFCLASEISAKVFCNMGVPVIYSLDKVELELIDVIVTGTCLGEGIDKQLVRLGNDNNITTISIIEHWSLYRKRFDLNGDFIYPDIIFVNDNKAKLEAENDGLPKDKLRVVGNPVLENIKRFEYSNKEKLDWKRSIGIDSDGGIVTFISESLKDDFHENSPEFYGFNEYEVLNDILSVISQRDVFIIKLHPAENTKKYDFLIKDNANIIVLKDTDISKLIHFSNAVVGMGSMLLLEASIVNRSVFSYRPNEQIGFIGNKNGMVEKINNKFELRKKLTTFENQNVSEVNNVFLNSTNKIIKLIEKEI